MGEEVKTKVCRGCGQDLPIDQYYFARKGSDARLSECRKCHNKRRVARGFKKQVYVKKPTGIDKLPEDERAGILKMVKDGAKMKDIHAAYPTHISYSNLCLLRRSGKLSAAK